MSKIKNSGLNQFGAEPFEQQQFGKAIVEGVNVKKLASNETVEHVVYLRKKTRNKTLIIKM